MWTYIRKRGPGVVRLLLIVAGLLFVAFLFEPTFRHKGYSEEDSAIITLRALNTAEAVYASTYNSGFTDTLSKLGAPASGRATADGAGLVDPILAGNRWNGTATTFTDAEYAFYYARGPRLAGKIDSYTITANPLELGRSFFTDQTGIVRANLVTAATASDSPI